MNCLVTTYTRLALLICLSTTTVCLGEDIVINGSFEEVGSNGLTVGWGADADGFTEFAFVTDWATDGNRAAMLGIQSGVGFGRARLTQPQRLFPNEDVQLTVSFDAIVERIGSPQAFAAIQVSNNDRLADPIATSQIMLPDTATLIQRFTLEPVVVPAVGEHPNDGFFFNVAVEVNKLDVNSTATIFVDNFRIDLTPVPEPAAWILMLAPLMILAGALRKRHR